MSERGGLKATKAPVLDGKVVDLYLLYIGKSSKFTKF